MVGVGGWRWGVHAARRRLPIEEAVRRKGEDPARSEGDELVGGGAQRARRVDHIVDDDAVRPLDVAHLQPTRAAG